MTTTGAAGSERAAAVDGRAGTGPEDTGHGGRGHDVATRWIGSAWSDQVIVWAWVPFAALGWLLAGTVAMAVAATYAFSRMFARQVGCGPAEYRARQRERKGR